MIPFNLPPMVGTEITYIKEAMETNRKLSGDGPFTKRCSTWMEKEFGVEKVLLTTSCTHALEIAALLAEIQTGDEVIMPSFTFVSTANAFVLRGAKIIFVDIRPDTMNMDEALIEGAITDKTKAIVPVHYAGVACEMDTILAIAKRHGLLVIEDAAQGVMATYKGRALGSMGDYGTFSFHETKNYTMGEGGALLIRDAVHVERAEIIREKGTDRSQFLRGQVDKYSWVGMGSSYLPSELNAAVLWAQLEEAGAIKEDRLKTWNLYAAGLKELEERGCVDLPVIPAGLAHNGHTFYMKCKDLAERTALIAFLREREIQAVFHYVPLHTSKAGRAFGRFHGEDRYTTRESERLVRLPLYYGMKAEDTRRVIDAVKEFYSQDIRTGSVKA